MSRTTASIYRIAWTLTFVGTFVLSSAVVAGYIPKPTGNPDFDLTIAIMKRDPEWVRSLVRAGAQVNPKGANQGEPLMAAAEYGPLATVKILVDAGAKLNVRYSNSRETALMTAASHQQVAIVAYLLKNGADAKLKSRDGWTALRCAKRGLAQGQPGRVGEVYPHEKADFREIIRLLQAHGAEE